MDLRSQGNDRRPDGDTRLRLVDLATPRGYLELGGALACVTTETDERNDVANAIARAVIGPRSPDVTGTIEIAGQYVELQSLPAPLLRPSASSTVDTTLFSELWSKTCAQRRAELEAAHAARRLERHRTDAAIERARRRVPASAPAPEPEVVPEPVIEIDEVTPQLEALLAAFDALTPVQDADALALATEFDALERDALVSAPAPSPVADDAALEAARARVEAARRALSATQTPAPATSRADVDSCHREVVEAERRLFEATKKEKAQASARYEAAVAAERKALAAAGADSYAGFLMAIAAGGPAAPPAPPGENEAERAAAKAELADATAELERLRAVVPAPAPVTPPANFAERDLELRARAAQLLGRFPNEDPAGELRAFRREHPDAARLRDEMTAVLATIDVAATRDVVGVARATVVERQAAPPQFTTPAPIPEAAPVTQPSVASAEDDALFRERAGHDDALAALEAELETVDRLRAATLDALDPDAATLAFASLLGTARPSSSRAAYRSSSTACWTP